MLFFWNVSDVMAHDAHPRHLFDFAFRCFFFGVSLLTIVHMLLWFLFYRGLFPVSAFSWLLPQYWHGHEMVFGFATGAVAGFLLTAVQSWTGVPTVRGRALAMMFAFWLLARLLWLAGAAFLDVAFVAETIFLSMLCFYFIRPVYRVKQKRQYGIIAKIVLLLLLNTGFYFAYVLRDFFWMKITLYAAFYIILALVLTVGRRVTPFFIQRATGFECRNSLLLDRLCLLSFVLFFLAHLSNAPSALLIVAALTTAGCQAWRLRGWYTPEIYSRPLLWSMFLAFTFIIAGFVMFAVRPWIGMSESVALHVFSVGGVGLMVLSMMGRVSLGHSGRSIHHPPVALTWAFLLILLCALVRVVLAWLLPAHYALCLNVSQILWMLTFGIFLWQYVPIWFTPDAKE